MHFLKEIQKSSNFSWFKDLLIKSEISKLYLHLLKYFLFESNL